MAETVGIFFSDPAMAAFLVLLSSIPHDERSAKKWKKKKVLGTIHILRQHTLLQQIFGGLQSDYS